MRDHAVLSGEPGDDLFFEPGTESRVRQIRGLGSWVSQNPFQLSARVRADFTATFDSAVLLGWLDDDRWFKVCAEIDPQGRTRVVSVVTRGRSDDSNGPFFAGEEVYSRVARVGSVFALHSSHGGVSWDLVRLFELSAGADEPLFLGIAVQSPTGEGTTALFREIQFSDQALTNPRSDT